MYSSAPPPHPPFFIWLISQPNPMDLLQLASAYHLPLLFAACQGPIAAHVDVHNAVEVLDIARLLKADDLAGACLACISFA